MSPNSRRVERHPSIRSLQNQVASINQINKKGTGLRPHPHTFHSIIIHRQKLLGIQACTSLSLKTYMIIAPAVPCSLRSLSVISKAVCSLFVIYISPSSALPIDRCSLYHAHLYSRSPPPPCSSTFPVHLHCSYLATNNLLLIITCSLLT